MSNIGTFIREVGSKPIWNRIDWIRFTNILYDETIQDERLLSIKNRLSYEFRNPTHGEINTILEVIRTLYTNNNLNVGFIEIYSRQLISSELFNLNRIAVSLESTGLVTGGGLVKDLFLVVGDSTSGGKGRTLGPITPTKTLYQWLNGVETEITTTDISTNLVGGPYGTQYKQFAIDYKALTGHSSVIITRGSSGAEFYPDGDTNNWYTSGVLYTAAIADAQACMVATGRPLTAIIMSLGINDVRGAQTIANINTAIDSLFTRLHASFPNIPILVIQVGRHETSVLDARHYSIRKKLRDVVLADSNAFFVSNNATFTSTNLYDVENLHLDQEGNNIQGSQIARWFKYSSYSKWGRSLICSMFDDSLGTTRRALVDNFIQSQVTSGNFPDFEILNSFVTTTEFNCFIDFVFLGCATIVGPPIFNINESYETDGIDDLIIPAFDAVNVDNSIISQDNFIFGVKLLENKSPDPSSGSMYGRRLAAANPGIVIVQASGTFTNFRCNDDTPTNSTVGRLQNNTLYSVARTGTTKRLIVNKVIDTSIVQASTGETPSPVTIGALRAGAVSTLPFAGKYQYAYAAKYTTFDLDNFYDNIEYMMTHWND